MNIHDDEYSFFLVTINWLYLHQQFLLNTTHSLYIHQCRETKVKTHRMTNESYPTANNNLLQLRHQDVGIAIMEKSFNE